MDSLSGAVERITFYNPENGYTVLRLRPDSTHGAQPFHSSSLSHEGLITVVGNLPELTPGEHLRLEGRWDKHPKHGSQFKAEICEQTLPATVAGIQNYLGSGMIKGIGPKLAERIVAKFKEQTLEVIEHQTERLLQVPGIGVDRLQKISTAWEEQKQVKEIMISLTCFCSSQAVEIFCRRSTPMPGTCSRRSVWCSITSRVCSLNFATMRSANFGPMPLIIPEPR